jgi:hypothetical protein
MGIDHVIDLDCVPKQTFSTAGILTRLKARERAGTILKLFRDNGDQRSPAEMGFEMVRRMSDGTEETQIVIVQDLLNEAAQLESVGRYCADCPANRTGRPFGCFGYINYPISQAAELWLLKQLPNPEEPLPFLLLNQTMRDFALSGEQANTMRGNPGVFFETEERFAKNLEDTQITTDQVFEMLFLSGNIKPAHGALLLIFFGGIPRDMDANVLMALTQPGSDHAVPFLATPEEGEDQSIQALKAFFHTLYIAFQLNATVSLDV